MEQQVECRYYSELEGAEPERGMKLLPRETADVSCLTSTYLCLILGCSLCTLEYHQKKQKGGEIRERE